MERLGEGLKKLALAGIGTAAYAAVSYTHLDVYKRQVPDHRQRE